MSITYTVKSHYKKSLKVCLNCMKYSFLFVVYKYVSTVLLCNRFCVTKYSVLELESTLKLLKLAILL